SFSTSLEREFEGEVPSCIPQPPAAMHVGADGDPRPSIRDGEAVRPLRGRNVASILFFNCSRIAEARVEPGDDALRISGLTARDTGAFTRTFDHADYDEEVQAKEMAAKDRR